MSFWWARDSNLGPKMARWTPNQCATGYLQCISYTWLCIGFGHERKWNFESSSVKPLTSLIFDHVTLFWQQCWNSLKTRRQSNQKRKNWKLSKNILTWQPCISSEKHPLTQKFFKALSRFWHLATSLKIIWSGKKPPSWCRELWSSWHFP